MSILDNLILQNETWPHLKHSRKIGSNDKNHRERKETKRKDDPREDMKIS